MSEKEKPELLTILLWVSLVPLAICLVLVVVIGYNYYKATHPDTTPVPAALPQATVAPVAPPPQTLQDTLQRLYASTITDLDRQIDATRSNLDTLRSHLDARTAESNELRTEITQLLHNGGTTTAELETVRQKIIALQQKVAELRQLNSNVEAENRRLKAMLARMNNIPATAAVQPAPNQPAATQPEKTMAPAATASDMRLTALYTADGEKELETTLARLAEKLSGTFSIRGGSGTADIMVVVIQPDGQVLQKSTWESGAFDTNEGRKIYSLKLRYDAALGAVQPYVFTLSAEHFIKGNYTLQLYQSGTLIGRMVKALG